MAPRVKTLIHIHTDYSFDSDITLDDLARFVQDEQIGCVAITDHDTIEGGRRFRHLTGAKVIVGEEVSTRDGHLVGLFLNERIQPGMSASDTARAIRGQGGIVLLPHPFVKAFGCGLRAKAWEILDLVDAVEVINAQNLLPGPDRKAREFARRTGIPGFAGADSHQATSIGPCFQMLSSFDSPGEFLLALRNAELYPGRHPLGYFVTAAHRIARELLRLRLPAGVGMSARRDHLPSSANSALAM